MRIRQSTKKNVSELLGKPIPIDVSLPSLDLFKDVFEAFQKGGSPSAGYNLPSGAIGPEKAHRMAWCLSEGDLDIRRESVRRCEVLEVMRDERHGRLHSRFSCTSASSEATHTLGYLGQARDFSPNAFGITGATKNIYKDFCTRYLDPPRGAIVEPCFLPDVYEHMRQVTEALAVDSAENEIVACRDMSTPTNGMPAFTPNNRFILRDAAHSGRRVLSRLFSACAVLRDILGLLVHWRDSLGQIIQHSLELRRIYKECCSSTKDSAVSTEFAHMRAAKHRIETFLTPLSRMILDMTAYLATAVQISIVRKGDREGRVATTFLETLNVVMLLCAACMCDASVCVMSLIRLFDTEDAPLADMCDAIEATLDQVTWLFHKGGCFTTCGHVSFLLEWLKHPHFYICNGVGRCIGGREVTDSENSEALQHMQAWTLLAKETLLAEFPQFSVICGFSAFKLVKGRPASGIPNKQKTQLQRLSQAFKKPQLLAQFTDHLPYALAVFDDSDAQMNYWDAWFAAIAKLSRIHAGGGGHPSDHLMFVLKRGRTFLPVTSGIEQSFSKVAQRLPPQRLNASSVWECRAVGLLVAKPDQHELGRLVKAAQTIWAIAFPARHARQHTVPRLDKGVIHQRRQHPGPADTASMPTERRFLKRLRDDIAASSTLGDAAVLDTFQPPIWTDKHAAELEFQRAKQYKKKVEVTSLLIDTPLTHPPLPITLRHDPYLKLHRRIPLPHPLQITFRYDLNHKLRQRIPL